MVETVTRAVSTASPGDIQSSGAPPADVLVLWLQQASTDATGILTSCQESKGGKMLGLCRLSVVSKLPQKTRWT
jgi:hypothetical protein